MKLTKEQFEALAPYERHFESAVNHRWTRFPGGAALDLIHDILRDVTGLNLPLNKCCSHCILELMTEMGKIYLADLEERNMAVKESLNATKKVDVTETETTNPVKVEVKTKRKYNRKAKA